MGNSLSRPDIITRLRRVDAPQRDKYEDLALCREPVTRKVAKIYREENMSDLLIISNRAPFSFSEVFLSEAEKCLKSGKAPDAPKFGEGGLVQAMSSLLKPGKWNPTWIGSSMGERDIEVARGHQRTLRLLIQQDG